MLWSPGARAHGIFRLNTANQTWVDTDTAVDPRAKSRCDCLWDGARLYIASHQQTSGTGASGHPSSSIATATCRRRSATRVDPGFPVEIANTSTESLVIDEDSSERCGPCGCTSCA